MKHQRGERDYYNNLIDRVKDVAAFQTQTATKRSLRPGEIKDTKLKVSHYNQSPDVVGGSDY
jgi:hypothetical protein